MTELFKQGAEAKLYKSTLFGKDVIIKERFKKSYRQPELDEKLTHKRTLQEARAMLRCRKAGIKTPLLYFVNYLNHHIYMENIVNSRTLREEIDDLLVQKSSDTALEQLRDIAMSIGQIISKMHSVDIIHGDLTTSNILVSKENTNSKNTYTLIDFGLSSVSQFSEDMGVDLYVLERAFLSTHPNTEWLFEVLLNAYSESTIDKKKNEDVIAKLEEIRLRGRKRVMIG